MASPLPKFDGVDFSNHIVTEYSPDQQVVGQGFRCFRGEFQTYIKGDKIKAELRSYTSKCWLINHEQGLASYITLLADKLSMGEPILISENVRYHTFPAVKIGWLAADQRAKGAGTRLLDWAMEYVVVELVGRLGIRFLTVDALHDVDSTYDASGFYLKHGFRYANPEDEVPPTDGYRTMYFDLLPLIDAINEAKSWE
jgi:GNAT superfamily N-acetyltransferase